ncbi:MAG: substrate-binding domain-containing protein [Polyangiaceae bacterium]
MSEPAKIAMFFLALDNDYQDLQRDVARVAAQRHHFTLKEVSAFNNGERQVTQVKECLAEPEGVRARAIVVCPVADVLMRPLAEDAARLGVAFVVVNRPCDHLAALRMKYPRVPLFGVSPDQKHVGCIQGQQFKKLLPRGGSVFYVRGAVGAASAEMRLEGVQRELANTDIKMVIENGDWSLVSGERAIQSRLRTPGAFTGSNWIVGAQNDLMAVGARSALQAAAAELKRPELAEIPVTGCDGTRTYGQTMVRTRKLAATVVLPPTAERAIDDLAQAFSSGKTPTVDVLLEAASFRALELIGAGVSGARVAEGPGPARSPVAPASTVGERLPDGSGSERKRLAFKARAT